MDAWIETLRRVMKTQSSVSHPSWMRGLKHVDINKPIGGVLVASLVDAWIETNLNSANQTYFPVASFVDAWIETFLTSYVLVNKIIFKLLSLFLLRCYVSL